MYGRVHYHDEGASCSCARVPVFFIDIFSQASQNVTVKVTVDCSVKRNKFSVYIPLHIEKTMSMFFVELWTCRAFFALGHCGLFHCNNCYLVSGSQL
jgi:hypothetical protein